MGGISFWHWLFALVYFGMFFAAAVRILNRLGYSGWWSLLAIIPIVNVVSLFLFSKAKWPRMDAASGVFD